jgi:hypothetical protein
VPIVRTILTATAFTLTLGLSGVAHAAFKDQSSAPESRPATAAARQDLSQFPTATGFASKSYYAAKESSTAAPAGGAPAGSAAHCTVQLNYKDRSSGPTC